MDSIAEGQVTSLKAAPLELVYRNRAVKRSLGRWGEARGHRGRVQAAGVGAHPGSRRFGEHCPGDAAPQAPELPSFLGVGTGAPSRRQGQSFPRASGPLGLLHPSLPPGHPASPRRRPPQDTLVIWVTEQDPRSTEDSGRPAQKLGAHALGGPGLHPRLAEP